MRHATIVVLFASACSHPTADASVDATADSSPLDDAATTPDPDAPALHPRCVGTSGGAYCGGDKVVDGDPATLYECPTAGAPPTSAKACALGCLVEPAGTEDRCATATGANTFRLPWRPATTMRLTQDCDDSCCSDHVGTDAYAYDWANGGSFGVVAARGGKITHLKINSTTGCASSSCSGDANFVVIDHGDGTQSTYFHLAGHSLAAGVACGATVERGQALAMSGTTGHSTGVHLHFQVSKVHPSAPTCECGADGTHCSASTVPYANFWVTSAYPSVPIEFDEWPTAAACHDRRITMPTSQND